MNQNPNSFEEAYELYFHRVVGFVYKMSKNEALSLDCAQEAFRLLSQKNISEVGNVLNWLFLCSKHRFFKQKAKMDRFTFVEDYSEFESALKTENDPQKDLADKETFDSTCEITEKLLKKLSEKQRKAIKLRFYNNLSYKEIAKKLKTTENCHRSKLITFRYFYHFYM